MIEKIELRQPFDGTFAITNDYQAHLKYSKAPGADFALPRGTPVLAAQSGRVIRSEWSEAGGRYVMVDHGHGMLTLYSHLRAVWRVKGERVLAGDTLGLSGSTGHATGPHLHFAVKLNGRWVDPMPLLQ